MPTYPLNSFALANQAKRFEEPPEAEIPEALSEREREIMQWVGEGKTNYEIGQILGISEFTVKNHLQRIFRKIDVHNRAQAVTRMRALGLAA